MGGLLGTMVSWILGGFLIAGGVIRIGLAVLAGGDDKFERREYDSGPRTYALFSSKPKG